MQCPGADKVHRTNSPWIAVRPRFPKTLDRTCRTVGRTVAPTDRGLSRSGDGDGTGASWAHCDRCGDRELGGADSRGSRRHGRRERHHPGRRIDVLDRGRPYNCTIDNGFNQNAQAACGRLAFSAAFEAWVWFRAVPSNVPAGTWQFGGWSGCDTTRVTGFGVECAVHSGPFTLDERQPVAIFNDVANPTISLAGIPARVANPVVSIGFSSTDPTAGFRCAIDSSAFAPCSPGNFNLPEGTHTFRVFAQDPSGRTSAQASQNVTVDTIAPTATIGGGPAEGSRVNSKAALFTLSANETATLFCSLDSATLVGCGAAMNLTGLSEGSHTVRLRANDGFRTRQPDGHAHVDGRPLPARAHHQQRSRERVLHAWERLVHIRVQ